jgi:putative ABC transport system substrate-binding protein
LKKYREGMMFKRRRIVAALGLGMLAAPFPAFAQREKVWRIGVMVAATPPQAFKAGSRYDAFLQGLREHGYIEGKNLAIEWRFGEGKYERLAEIAATLVDQKVDLIVATASPTIRAAQSATRTIPIVMVATADPVGSGFVASLARPGGNITGLTGGVTAITAKHVELLSAAVPRLSRFGVLANPGSSSYRGIVGELAVTAHKMGMKLAVADLKSQPEIEPAFEHMRRERVEGLVVVHEALILTHRRQIAEAAAKHRLPAVYGTRDYIEAGGLMSYGTSITENYRRVATYIDRIIKGAKPSDLPVEQPTKFELVINLKAAKALGLTIPTDLLLRAEQVIV